MLRAVRVRSIAVASCLGLAVAAAPASAARAQANPFQALAEHLTAPKPGTYRGPTVSWPEIPARPSRGALRARSLRLPLVVHARQGVPTAQVAAALAALERAYHELEARGFPLPLPSMTEDGAAAIDVYLQPTLAAGASAGVGLPRPRPLAALDAGEAFGLLDEALAPDELERCALAALAEAGLLGQDPAEPRGALAAAAAVAVWLAYGELGCRPDPVRMQRAARLGPLGEDAGQVDAAALWLASLLQRHDPRGRGLLPGLFAAARQLSAQAPSALHARPTFWQALDQVLSEAGESLDDAAIELATIRWLLPARGGTAYGVPSEARVQLAREVRLAELPQRVTPEAPLRTYGSAYAVVDTRGAGAGAQLRVWLRAEPGPRWSLVALTLDAEGAELGKLAAPPRTTPESFLPIELDARTARVVLIVTKLPRTRGERALADDDEHGFELTLDSRTR